MTDDKGRNTPEKRLVCYLCKKPIDKNERHCDLVSNESGKVINTDSWHAQCWTQWLQGLVKKGLQNTFSQSMQILRSHING